MNNKSTIYIYILTIISIVFTSCDAFEIHPYSGNIPGKKNINIQNIARIERLYAHKDTIRYAFISDSQNWYDDLEDFVKDVNNRKNIDFIIHGGDLTNFGLTKEFIWQRDILEKLIQPYVVLIGNHDCLANGEEIFEKIYGNPNFSFIAGKTKFLCMNTNALESNYSVPIPDFEFIKKESKQDLDRFENTIAVMHANPGCEQFNNNVSDVFQYNLHTFPNLLFAMHGHHHLYKAADIFEDNVMYYGVPNIGKRQYFVFTISNNTYQIELVAY